jgi:hypothetical protein
MTVEDLMEALAPHPPSARVVVMIRQNEDGSTRYEFGEVDISAVVRSYGEVKIQLDE